jgi:NADP-dependent 3-hydroxy acid dehydrogenase YdfG
MFTNGANGNTSQAASQHFAWIGAQGVLGGRRTDSIQKRANEIQESVGNSCAIATAVTKLNRIKKLFKFNQERNEQGI